MATPEPAPIHGLEGPEQLGRNLWAGSRLLAGALSCAFLAFLFAFWYLRVLDSNGLWAGPQGQRPEPPLVLGVATACCVLLAVAIFHAAARALERDAFRIWTRLSVLALALSVGALGLLVWQFAAIDFGPTSGGYASVFIGWTAFLGLCLLGALYWLETLVAQSLSSRHHAPVGEHTEITDASSLLSPEAKAFAFFYSFLGAVALLTFAMLYVVR
jgi:heme/copper-type cytochrome/quinol oxidase subunit 3